MRAKTAASQVGVGRSPTLHQFVALGKPGLRRRGSPA